MKTTIDLPESLLRELSDRAVLEHRTVDETIAAALRTMLGSPPSHVPTDSQIAARVEIDASGIPTVRPNLSSLPCRLTVEQILELEWQSQVEEDLARVGLSV